MSQTWNSVWHFIERPRRDVNKMKRIRECLESSKELREWWPEVYRQPEERACRGGGGRDADFQLQEVMGHLQWSISGAVRKKSA